MQVVLDEKFYKSVIADMKKYEKNYDAIRERSKELDRAEWEKLNNAEHSYEILEKFGAV